MFLFVSARPHQAQWLDDRPTNKTKTLTNTKENETSHEKTNNLHIRKQSRRSAVQ